MPGISTLDMGTDQFTDPNSMPVTPNWQWDLPQPTYPGTVGQHAPASNFPLQPQTTYRGGKPGYYIAPTQYTPLPTGPMASGGDSVKSFQNIWKQIIPTSVNLRNRNLSELLKQMQTPMESVYAAGPSDQAADSYGSNQGALASALASRGLMGSGAQDVGQRENALSYITGMGNAVAAGRNQADQRRLNQINQLLAIPQQDLQFYQAIRSGSLPAGQVTNPPNFGWPMLAQGLAQLVKTVASMGAGAAGAGGASGAALSGGQIASSGAGQYLGMGGVGDALSSLGYAGGAGGGMPAWLSAAQPYMGAAGYGLGSYTGGY